MATNWQSWCRLCAYEGNDIDVFFKLESVTELSQLVQKHFMISVCIFFSTCCYIIYPNYLYLINKFVQCSICLLIKIITFLQIHPQDESPTSICSECYSFVGKLERFAVRCVKVDKMFAELIFDKSNILDSEIDSVRCKYGLDEEDVSFSNCDQHANKNLHRKNYSFAEIPYRTCCSKCL